jgi:hypothetical protein
MTEDELDGHEAQAVWVESDDPEQAGLWLRSSVPMDRRSPDPYVRRLQELIMGRVRVSQHRHEIMRSTWREATDEQWGRFMLRMLANDKKITKLA